MTDANDTAPPPGRRDARRNRERLVEAARRTFAEQGLDAPFDVVARRAGVGNATLYRHFPTRAALVDAVFGDLLAATSAAGERARSAPDPWEGLVGYLEHVFAGLAADRGSNDLMTAHLPDSRTLEAVHAHNRRTVELLLARGREHGSVRPDLTPEDVLLALAALGRTVPALAGAAGPGAWRRPLALLLDGFRASPGHGALPSPALRPEQFDAVLHRLGPHRAAPTRPGGPAGT
ncbi:TetR/AcrR family transcriptional regulator [Kitasatospora sp. NPDC088391]|uniref:TetR/AcrR family transcriptional regulator n=1 Tax=Kitasatospora sp. NPDC088391 TaxID=3364074 RepID=UPI0037F1B111